MRNPFILREPADAGAAGSAILSALQLITGDITQIDLPNPRQSGLVDALRIVKDIEGIGFVYFDDNDKAQNAKDILDSQYSRNMSQVKKASELLMIVEADGTVTVNNDQAKAAIERAEITVIRPAGSIPSVAMAAPGCSFPMTTMRFI